MFCSDNFYLHATASVGAHHVLYNVLQSAFVLSFSHSQFLLSQILIVFGFIDLSWLYFRYQNLPLLIHISVVAGPLSWAFVAIYWNGAFLFHDLQTLPAEIVGSVLQLGIFGYGFFFIYYFKVSIPSTIKAKISRTLMHCWRTTSWEHSSAS